MKLLWSILVYFFLYPCYFAQNLLTSSKDQSFLYFVAQNTFYRSSNFGESWQSVGDFNPLWNSISENDMEYTIGALGTNAKGDVVVAAADCGIFRSLDNGLSWDVTYVLPETICSYNSIASDAAGKIIFASGSCRLLKSVDSGSLWTEIKSIDSSEWSSTGTLDILDMAVSESGSTVVAAPSESVGILLFSNNSGLNWTILPSNYLQYWCVGLSSNNSVINVIASSGGLVYTCQLDLHSFEWKPCVEIAKMRDGGKSIYRLYCEIDQFNENYFSVISPYTKSISVSYDSGATWFHSNMSVSVVSNGINRIKEKKHLVGFYSLDQSILKLYSNYSLVVPSNPTFSVQELEYTCPPGCAIPSDAQSTGVCSSSAVNCLQMSATGNLQNNYIDGTSKTFSLHCSNFPNEVPNGKGSACISFCSFPYIYGDDSLSCEAYTEFYYHDTAVCSGWYLNLPPWSLGIIIVFFVCFYLLGFFHVSRLIIQDTSSFSLIFDVAYCFVIDTSVPYLDTFTDLLFLVNTKFCNAGFFYSALTFYLLHPFLETAMELPPLFLEILGSLIKSYSWVDLEQADNLPKFLVFIIQHLILISVAVVLIVPITLLSFILHSTRFVAINNFFGFILCLPQQKYESLSSESDQVINASALKSVIAYGYILETIPQLIITSLHTATCGELTITAILSMSFSAMMIANGIYTIWHTYVFERPSSPPRLNELATRHMKEPLVP